MQNKLSDRNETISIFKTRHNVNQIVFFLTQTTEYKEFGEAMNNREQLL